MASVAVRSIVAAETPKGCQRRAEKVENLDNITQAASYRGCRRFDSLGHGQQCGCSLVGVPRSFFSTHFSHVFNADRKALPGGAGEALSTIHYPQAIKATGPIYTLHRHLCSPISHPVQSSAALRNPQTWRQSVPECTPTIITLSLRPACGSLQPPAP